jgi:hypothetical protein
MTLLPTGSYPSSTASISAWRSRVCFGTLLAPSWKRATMEEADAGIAGL